MTTSQLNAPGYKYRGPHPGIPALIYVLLFMGSLVLFPVLSHGSAYPSPFGDIAGIRQLLQHFPGALQTTAFLQFAAAVPLGIFTAAVVSRISALGLNVAGLRIAMFGGIAASLLVSLSALFSWVLCQPDIAADTSSIQVLRLLAFATGGIGHSIPLGLLMAGISLPCLFGKYTPSWIAWLGIVLAVLAELSIFGLVWSQAFFLLPVVRFGSYIWMTGTGFSLLKTKTGIYTSPGNQ